MFCITGKRAFIAGVADDQGFGWAIAKALSAAGAEILLGTWVPVHSPISVLCQFPS
jgi:enoyl-[acyl-carrier protein] reductase I